MHASKCLLALTVLLLVSIGSPTKLSAGEASTILIPKAKLPINFSHKQHVVLNIKCSGCHLNAARSTKARDNLLPEMETCITCHRLDVPNPAKAYPKSNCDNCHPGYDATSGADPMPVRVASPSITFSHRTHTVLAIGCSECHAGIQNSTKPEWEHIPLMEDCLRCHNGKFAPTGCQQCHLTEPNGRLKTNLPGGVLKPDGTLFNADHYDPAWIFRHRVPAMLDDTLCANCHAQTECQSCHAGNVKPTFHGNNYIALHSRDAYMDRGTCDSCHLQQRDCQGCHATAGLVPALGQPLRSGRVHPPGWDSFSPGANHHGPVARRGVAGCTGCHSEQDCMTCHASNTLRINPHPPGFSANGRSKTRDLPCRKCHL